MKKTAFIVGGAGQDGSYLSKLLVRKGYTVIGIDIKSTKVYGGKKLKQVNINNFREVKALTQKFKPHEIYYLAAFHHSSEEKPISTKELFKKSYDVNVFGFINFLEAVRLFSPSTKVFYASSCLIFGESLNPTQNENTPFIPNNIYAVTKADGLLIGRLYRKDFGLFVSTGILYNHESVLRPKKFLSMKIVNAVKNIKQGNQKELVVGNLSAEVDWGYAPDFVEAMWLILQHHIPDEYIVATGIKHSVKEFVKLAFLEAGLDWRKYVKENSNVLTRNRKTLVGDYSKIKNELGWRPKVSFEEMVKLLIKENI